MPLPLGRRITAGPGVPVVLLHGLGDNFTTWDRFTADLGRHTVAFDLRGHGTSPRSDEYTVDALAEDVVAALDGVDVVDVVGHSMGGFVATLLATRIPQRVRRLVLEDAPVPPRDGPPLPDEPPERPTEPIDFDWAVVAPLRRGVRVPNPQWWQGIERFGAPTLWLSGGPTSHLAPERVASAVEVMPDATMRTIPVGHLIHETAPAAFADAVIPFLSARFARGEPATP
jgi:pimeloyl-ACP methyl ester carboxylesterase